MAVGFHADGVDDGVGAASVHHLDERGGGVVELVWIDRLDAESLCRGASLGHPVDADNASNAERLRDPSG